MMMLVVLRVRQQFEVFRPVVQGIAIHMMNVLTSAEATSEMLFDYDTMLVAPTGSAGAGFDLPVDQRWGGMMNSGATQRQQILCAEGHSLLASAPVFVAVARDEFCVTLDMAFARSAFAIDDRRQSTTTTSAEILSSKSPHVDENTTQQWRTQCRV